MIKWFMENIWLGWIPIFWLIIFFLLMCLIWGGQGKTLRDVRNEFKKDD